MATHHCIGNPCWICNPSLSPNEGYWAERTKDYMFKQNNISDLLEEMLIYIFDSGLDEDAHYRFNDDLTLDKIIEERSRIANDTLPAKLLDRMIDDFKFKKNYED